MRSTRSLLDMFHMDSSVPCIPSGPRSFPFTLHFYSHCTFHSHHTLFPFHVTASSLILQLTSQFNFSLSTFDLSHTCERNLHIYSLFRHKFGSGFAALPHTIASYTRFINLKGRLSILYHPFPSLLPRCLHHRFRITFNYHSASDVIP